MPATVEVLSSSSDDEGETVTSPPQQSQLPQQPGPTRDAKADGVERAQEAVELPAENDAAAAADDAAADSPDGEALVEVDLEKCKRLKVRGNELFGEGKVDEALAHYRQAILKAPIKPIQKPKRSAGAAAAAEFDQDDECGDDAAKDTTDTAAKEAAGDEAVPDTTDYTLTSQVFCNAGYCLMKLEVYDEAVEMLSEAIRHDEQYQKAYLRRAESYYNLEKWSSAYGDYESYAKLGGSLDAASRARHDTAKKKTDEEMQKMLGDLKDLGNRFLGNFGLSTDMFKFDKDPNSGGYSMRFERN